MSNRVLVVAAHPDDEVLGCGGAIARHRAGGDEVTTLFLADGVGSRDESSGGATDPAIRRAAGNAAAEVLGAAPPIYLDFPDNRLDTVALLDVARAIERVAAEFRPDRVYTHHCGDLNIDHRVCHQAVLTAFRPMPGQTVRAIFGFEVPSSTEWAFGGRETAFQPNHFVDISSFMAAKAAALRCYEMELRPFPHPRSARMIEALAGWRGAIAGCEAAEAFTVIRQIV